MPAIFYAYGFNYKAPLQAGNQVLGFLSPLYCRAGRKERSNTVACVLLKQVVVAGIEVSRPTAELEGEAGPEGGGQRSSEIKYSIGQVTGI